MAKKMLHEMAVSVLSEIKDLPSKVTNPNWLETVEDDDAAAKQPGASFALG